MNLPHWNRELVSRVSRAVDLPLHTKYGHETQVPALLRDAAMCLFEHFLNGLRGSSITSVLSVNIELEQ